MSEREPIPSPRTPADGMLGVIARRQDETNDLLQKILDRLPAHPTAERADGTVELTEPKRPPAKGKGGGGGRRTPAGATGPRPVSRRKPDDETDE